MTELTPMAISAAPLLRAIAAGGDLSPKALAEASGRKSNNIARDLARVAEQGWVTREPGSPPALTGEGQGILDTLDSKGPAPPAPDGEGFAHVPLDLIDRDPTLNPREIFDDAELEALASSIRDKGVAQPILLRLGLEAGRFRIVAGERRFRASQKAGRPTIPAMIRDLDDAQALEIATIENIQRVNLSPLEEAKAFKKIIANRMAADAALELKDAKASIADAVRKTVRYVEQRMDLLELPPILQKRLELDPDDHAYLNLKEARREVQNMRSREREAKAKILPVDELLALAEIYDAAEKYGEKLQGWWQGERPVPVGKKGLEEGEALAKLVKRDAVVLTRGWKADPRNFVHIGWRWTKKDIEAQLNGFLSKDRTRVLHVLRYKVLGETEANRLNGTWLTLAGTRGEYASWWLNEPFIDFPDDDLVEAAEEARRRMQEQDALAFNRRADELQAEEAAKARKAQTERDQGPWGKDFLAAVRALETDAADMDHAAFTAAFAEVQSRFDCGGPYGLRPTENGNDCEIHDFGLRDTKAAGPALEARRRLFVIALNFAAGHAVISAPDLDMPWSREPEPEVKTSIDGLSEEDFVRAVAGILVEDAEEDLADDRACEMAARGLAAFLDQEGIDYGDAEYDWDETGAMALAQGIQVDGLGAELIAAMPPADEDQDAQDDTPEYLARLAGGGGAAAEPELEREEG